MRNLRYLSALLLTVLLFTSCGADKNLKRGEKYLALGEYFDAGNEYKTAYSKTPAKERPRRGQIAKKMAYCYEKINSTQKAIAAYRNVIRYNQDDGATHLSFAQQLMKNGNYKEAAEQYRIALDSMPDNQLARDGLSAALDAPTLYREEDGHLQLATRRLLTHAHGRKP